MWCPRAAAASAVQELLDLVGLNPEHINRYPHQFSGGQRQRIGIARGVALNPKVIICDEPVSALDVSVQAQVVNLLEELQDELGLAYVFIAHDLSVVRHISDRVGVMYLGKMVEIGDEDQIYSRPTHPYTQALLSAVPVPGPDAARHAGADRAQRRRAQPGEPAAGCRFHTRCWKAQEKCTIEEPLLIMRPDGSRRAPVGLPLRGGHASRDRIRLRRRLNACAITPGPGHVVFRRECFWGPSVGDCGSPADARARASGRRDDQQRRRRWRSMRPRAPRSRLVTCTLGEEGEVLVDDLIHLAADRQDDLGQHRLGELKQAMDILGVTDFVRLGGDGRFRDSGMAYDERGHGVARDVLRDDTSGPRTCWSRATNWCR